MCICKTYVSSVSHIGLLLPPDCKASINRRVQVDEVPALVSNPKRFLVFGTCTVLD